VSVWIPLSGFVQYTSVLMRDVLDSDAVAVASLSCSTTADAFYILLHCAWFFEGSSLTLLGCCCHVEIECDSIVQRASSSEFVHQMHQNPDYQ
jgi:hypothetical protein